MKIWRQQLKFLSFISNSQQQVFYFASNVNVCEETYKMASRHSCIQSFYHFLIILDQSISSVHRLQMRFKA